MGEKIEVELYDFLKDMKKELSTKVDNVHEDVKEMSPRITALEVSSERHETRGKWLVRVMSGMGSALAAYLGLHHTP